MCVSARVCGLFCPNYIVKYISILISTNCVIFSGVLFFSDLLYFHKLFFLCLRDCFCKVLYIKPGLDSILHVKSNENEKKKNCNYKINV